MIQREIEWLCATYNLTPEQAIWDWPIVLTQLFMPAYNIRQGGDSDVSGAADKASSLARLAKRASLEARYTIVDKPVSEVGWQFGDKPTIVH